MENNNNTIEKNISTGFPEPWGKVLLVDCMDTILYRDITLEALLSIWAKKMGKEFRIYQKFMYNYRKEVVASKMHNTVSIDVIYGEIYDHCVHFGLIESCNRSDFIDKAHSLELEIELKHHHPIPDIINYLKAAKEKGTQIYCVSDFRLPSSDIIKFFSQQGIDYLFNGVFSSCDIGKTKKEGALYNCVLKRIQKLPSECIMIGDNYKSDYVNAKKAGIYSYWIKDRRRSYRDILKDLLIRYL